MPRSSFPLLAAAVLCLAAAPARASNCAGTSVGLVPLTDLGTGTYQGYQGGLYAGGSSHRPAAHDAAGVSIATALAPLDTLGQPDAVNGRFVLISIGMSNATMEFAPFVQKAMGYSARHPKLLVIDCAKGGQSANLISSPTAAYWDTVFTRLRGRGSAPLQAQAVWIKEADPGPTGGFPAATNTLLAQLGSIVRIIHQKMPNVRLVYFTSRIYAGYASSTLNPEPYAYESGFAVKWLIEAQVSGVDSLNYDPGQGAVEAPWLAWGPYLWADGLVGRADSLKWTCDEFVTSDGTHPSALGTQLVSDSLLQFFSHDETTVPWFLAGPLAVEPSVPRIALAAAPNPAAGAVTVSFTPRAGERWWLEVLDPSGRRVRTLASGVGQGAVVRGRWDGRDDSGARLAAGVYWVRVAGGSAPSARRVVLLSSE
ncbi:MAG: hypothetical protein HZC42_02690 [Candidatus Eisenbacteria bacterium]|nr:hypothetical protein [Candidatus Eisenbacteria bacterium]